MPFFFRKSIKRRVLKVIYAKLEAAQKAFDEEVKGIELYFKKQLTQIETDRDNSKETAATKHVDNIIGKLK